MKPFRTLAETRTPDGSRLTLHEHDGDIFLKLDGRQLMSTTSTSSELMLAQESCAGLAHQNNNPRVLIGGLGLGFSLQRVLELSGPNARVEVAELLPEVVAWNRELLRAFNGTLLEDARVKVIIADVFAVIARSPKAAYAAILLDVDNGPTSFVQKDNSRIYDRRGLRMISRALAPGGRVAFWSAVEEPDFPGDLTRAGFRVEVFPAKPHERSKQSPHRIYVAQRRSSVSS